MGPIRSVAQPVVVEEGFLEELYRSEDLTIPIEQLVRIKPDYLTIDPKISGGLMKILPERIKLELLDYCKRCETQVFGFMCSYLGTGESRFQSQHGPEQRSCYDYV